MESISSLNVFETQLESFLSLCERFPAIREWGKPAVTLGGLRTENFGNAKLSNTLAVFVCAINQKLPERQKQLGFCAAEPAH